MINNSKVKSFLIKYKEKVALVAMGIVFGLFVAGGVYLQKANREEKLLPADQLVEKVELKVPGNEDSEKSGENVSGNESYFLKPSPQELLDQLTSMENLNEDVVEKKYAGFRVLWPLYFFNITIEEGDNYTALLDVSEDGFGTLVQTTFDIKKFPDFLKLEQGVPVWLGGEIIAVDLTGTGTIFIKIEQLSKEKNVLQQTAFSPPVEE